MAVRPPGAEKIRSRFSFDHRRVPELMIAVPQALGVRMEIAFAFPLAQNETRNADQPADEIVRDASHAVNHLLSGRRTRL